MLLAISCGRGLAENEVERTEKVKIKQVEFLAAGEALKATFNRDVCFVLECEVLWANTFE